MLVKETSQASTFCKNNALWVSTILACMLGFFVFAGDSSAQDARKAEAAKIEKQQIKKTYKKTLRHKAAAENWVRKRGTTPIVRDLPYPQTKTYAINQLRIWMRQLHEQRGETTKVLKQCRAAGFPSWYCPTIIPAAKKFGKPEWAFNKSLAGVINYESRFNPNAQNKSSTAFGLFQFLDSTWKSVGCRKTWDAFKQTLCGLAYVKGRYRTPERARNSQKINGWY